MSTAGALRRPYIFLKKSPICMGEDGKLSAREDGKLSAICAGRHQKERTDTVVVGGAACVHGHIKDLLPRDRYQYPGDLAQR